jgi:hypothetical protein
VVHVELRTRGEAHAAGVDGLHGAGSVGVGECWSMHTEPPTAGWLRDGVAPSNCKKRRLGEENWAWVDMSSVSTSSGWPEDGRGLCRRFAPNATGSSERACPALGPAGV